MEAAFKARPVARHVADRCTAIAFSPMRLVLAIWSPQPLGPGAAVIQGNELTSDDPWSSWPHKETRLWWGPCQTSHQPCCFATGDEELSCVLCHTRRGAVSAAARTQPAAPCSQTVVLTISTQARRFASLLCVVHTLLRQLHGSAAIGREVCQLYREHGAESGRLSVEMQVPSGDTCSRYTNHCHRLLTAAAQELHRLQRRPEAHCPGGLSISEHHHHGRRNEELGGRGTQHRERTIVGRILYWPTYRPALIPHNMLVYYCSPAAIVPDPLASRYSGRGGRGSRRC